MSEPITLSPLPGDPRAWALSGELDVDTAPRFSRTLLESLQASSGGRVQLRCGELSFIDSTGLLALLQLTQVAAEHGVDLKIVEPSRQMRRLLQLTGTDRLLLDA